MIQFLTNAKGQLSQLSYGVLILFCKGLWQTEFRRFNPQIIAMANKNEVQSGQQRYVEH